MSSIKARKGNPFEYNTLYSLQENGYNVIRLDDNSKGIDLIITNETGSKTFVECKRHKGFSWNQLVGFYDKTKETVGEDETVLLVFKANRQPTLVMYEQHNRMLVEDFDTFFVCEWKKRPKGWKTYDNTSKTK